MTVTAQPQPLTYRWSLTVRVEEIPHFRRLAKAAIREWGQPPRVAETVLHGVTELLSNVHRHVPDDRRCVLELAMVDGAVYVTVEDHCGDAPAVSVPDWTSERGRGLWMLREMAEGFGYVPTAGGKRVWVRVRASRAGRQG